MRSIAHSRSASLLAALALLVSMVAFDAAPAVADGEPTVAVGTKSGSTFTPDVIVVDEGAGDTPFAVQIAGFDDPTPADDWVAVTLKLPAGGGSMSVQVVTGLTLSYGYSGFTEVGEVGFYGRTSDVEAALEDRLVWHPPADPSGPLELDVAAARHISGTYYLSHNGHYYEPVDNGSNITWSDAKVDAESRTLHGMQGYLATITSADENDFVSTYTPAADVWIGASDDSSFTADPAEGNWYWVSGPENGTQFWTGDGTGATVGGQYASWAPGEPNNHGTGEDFAVTNWSGALGEWNDLANDNGSSNYLVEYGGMPSDATDIPTATTTGSFEVAALPPINSSPPSIPSAPEVGYALDSDPGVWSNPSGRTLTHTYQWQRCEVGSPTCENISGATSSSYTPTADDAGSELRVMVTTGDGVGPEVDAASNRSDAVTYRAPVNEDAPSLTRRGISWVGGAPAELINNGVWDGSPTISYTYQWSRCDTPETCEDIDGATEDIYAPVVADYGKFLRVAVTATNAGGSAVVSVVSSEVRATAPKSTLPPTVDPSPTVGHEASADIGEWESALPAELSVQWQRCLAEDTCVDIPGATSSTYTPTEADVGFHLRMSVTATTAATSMLAESDLSDPVLWIAPELAVAPVVDGDPADGAILEVGSGVWDVPSPTVSFQWVRCDEEDNCEDIDGATSDTYQPGVDDIGWRIGVRVTASNPGGSNSETVMFETPVSAKAPAVTSDVAVYGDLEPGQTLTATAPAADASGEVSVSYQWQRCSGDVCVDVEGATDSSYVLSDSDAGFKLKVVATISDGYGNSVESSDTTDHAIRTGEPVFVDVGEDAVFFGDVQWLATQGITRGCNPPDNDLFCPEDGLTRAEMATFLVRAFDLPAEEANVFADDDKSVHEANINALAASDITRSCNPDHGGDLYCPDRIVTRAELASFLVRALDLPPVDAQPFVDTVGSVHADDITALAAAGITLGCNPGNGGDHYCPDENVTRGQVAAMLHRADLAGIEASG